MPNVNLSVPDEVLWKLRAQAVAAKERFGPYCVRVLVQQGLGNLETTRKAAGPVSGASGAPVAGSAVRGPRKGVAGRQEAALGVVALPVSAEAEEAVEKDDAISFDVAEFEEQEPAGGPELVKELVKEPGRKPRTTCTWCGSPTKPFSATNVQCTVCKRNGSAFIEE